MSMRSDTIDWEVLRLEECLDKDYLGGLRIGAKFIYMLEHRRLDEQGKLRAYAPAFLVFEGKGKHKDRGKGTPMSMRDFEKVLALLFTSEQRKAVEKALYDPVKLRKPKKRKRMK